MVIFRLEEKASINLEGIRVSTAHRIRRETEKAVLLEVVTTTKGIGDIVGMDIRTVGYWLPKSQITYDSKKIEIPDWLWQKKREAMDYIGGGRS
jgi:hypothetical protein